MTFIATRPARTLSDTQAQKQESPLAGVVDCLVLSDGTSLEYPVLKGYKPFMVFVAGEKYYEGDNHDYTVKYDGFLYTVVFNNVAPPAGNMSFLITRVV